MQWNTLDVPLENGWQCTLYRAAQYRDVERDRLRAQSNGWSEGRDREEDARRLRERDKRDFERYFRPRSDLHTVTGVRELDVVRSFLTEVLSVAHWHLPVDNEGIRRALTGAVTSGQLVPVINREWRALPRVMRPNPAPEKWPSSGTGGFSGIGEYGRGKWAAFEKAGPGLLTLNGEPVLRGPYDPSTWEAQLKAARAEMAASSANSSGAAWDATAVAFDFHPVESRSTATDADVLTIAARGVSEEQESECFGQYERDMMACDMIGAMYRDPRTFAECTRRAFSNYQICRGY